MAVDLGAALVGLRLADEHLDERRLAGAVRADARDARRLRHLDGDVLERRLAGARLARRAQGLLLGPAWERTVDARSYSLEGTRSGMLRLRHAIDVEQVTDT